MCVWVCEVANREASGQGVHTLTLLIPLVSGVLERQAHRAVLPCAVLPVGDDLSGRGTVRHCVRRQRASGEREGEREKEKKRKRGQKQRKEKKKKAGGGLLRSPQVTMSLFHQLR